MVATILRESKIQNLIHNYNKQKFTQEINEILLKKGSLHNKT